MLAAATRFLAREWRGSASGCGTRQQAPADALCAIQTAAAEQQQQSARFSSTVSLPGAGTDHGPSDAVAGTARREPHVLLGLRGGHATSHLNPFR